MRAYLGCLLPPFRRVDVVGEVFAGRFELIEPVADGGMGSIWRVRDRRDQQVYAGKLLRQSDAGSLLRFIREQSTRVQHPHIVTPLSWAGEDDRVLFTMPFVDGGSVAVLLGDSGPLPPAWTVLLLDQTLQALEAVHDAGIVHRDVKPANLLLRATGGEPPHLLLSDFGIAARCDEPRLTQAWQVLGSPGYMHPDQQHGADPAPSHDVYSVGMVGLELVTGLRPPRGREAAASDPPPGQAELVALLLEATAVGATGSTAAELRTRLAALPPYPMPQGPDAPFVFEHLPGDAEAEARPAEPSSQRPLDTGAVRRVLAGLLLVIALACLVAAVLVVF